MNKPVMNDSGAVKYTLSKAAAALGSKGGKSSSPEKVKAAKENGKQGGGHHPK